MIIRPSATIRQNYNEISEMCKKTKEPVFLTKNGEGDLVVMDIETFNRREKMLKLREELLAVEEDRMNGSQGYSVSEVVQMMNNVIKKVNDKNIRHFGYMIGDEMIIISDYRFLKSNTKFKVRWNQFIN